MMGKSKALKIGVLAQLVEQWTLNPFVASSILARPTNIQAASRAYTLEAVFNSRFTDYIWVSLQMG